MVNIHGIPLTKVRQVENVIQINNVMHYGFAGLHVVEEGSDPQNHYINTMKKTPNTDAQDTRQTITTKIETIFAIQPGPAQYLDGAKIHDHLICSHLISIKYVLA